MYTRWCFAVATSTSTSSVDLRADSLSVQPDIVYLFLLLIASQESEQSEIELKEDSPDVLEGVLRYIYGCETEDCHQQPWHYWLELVGYLEPRWSEDAADRFEMSALSLQKVDVEEICDVLETLQDTEKYELFESFAVDLTLRHLYLLDDERFRALVYNCKQIMFKLVERLSFAADLVPVKLFYDHHGEIEVYLKRCNGDCSTKR
jgi:hypothetical protein